MIKILFLDDSIERQKRFKAAIDKLNSASIYYKVFVAYTAKEAIDLLKQHEFEEAHLDHDLGGEVYVTRTEETGYEVALFIAEMEKEKRPKKIIIHSWNPVGVKRMWNVLEGKVSQLFFHRFSI